MPYIKPERRKELDAGQVPAVICNAGELNYLLTKELLRYLGPFPNYQRFNDCIGALEACKLELYRRMVVSYEDTKIKENGDVYP